MKGFITRHRPSPAMAVALRALGVALGGTGYAAITLPKNSVKALQIAKNAVRSAEVKNRSLRAVDVKLGVLRAGPRGPEGPQGPQGDAGAPGQPGATKVIARVDAGTTVLPNNSVNFDDVKCAPGERAVGGGGGAAGGQVTDAVLTASSPTLDDNFVPTGWRVTYRNAGADNITAAAVVVCASP